MRTRSLVLAASLAVLVAAPVARADVALGVFAGEPTGLDIDLGLTRRSSLDLLLGWTRIPDGRDHYAHVTYLVTPAIARGESVLVPLRLGIGLAVYDDGNFDNGLNLGARVPLEVALRFRRTPLEIYGEISVLVTFLDDNNNDPTFGLHGGLGLRFYF